jgi:nucleoside 2-deoxyribosyltransferase
MSFFETAESSHDPFGTQLDDSWAAWQVRLGLVVIVSADIVMFALTFFDSLA